MYVPDYCMPVQQQQHPQQPGTEQDMPFLAGSGVQWQYSEALVRAVEAFRTRFPWFFRALESRQGDASAVTLADFFPPDTTLDSALAQLNDAQKFIKSLPLGRRPLVRSDAKVASEFAIRQLQASLPAATARRKGQAPTEVENVSPGLLLKPVDRTAAELSSVLLGQQRQGGFELADRVVHVGASGTPPFGLRGTVVGVHDEGAFCEILFDQDFIGGSDLNGRCNGQCGAVLPGSVLINLSRPSQLAVPQHLAPRVAGRQVASAQGPRVRAGGSAAEVERQLRLEAALAQDPKKEISSLLQDLELGAGATQQPPAPPKPRQQPQQPRPQTAGAAPAAQLAPGDAGARLLQMVRGGAAAAAAPAPPAQQAKAQQAKYATPGLEPQPPAPPMPKMLAPSAPQQPLPGAGAQLLAALQGRGPPPPPAPVPMPPVPMMVPYPAPGPYQGASAPPRPDPDAGKRLLAAVLAPGLKAAQQVPAAPPRPVPIGGGQAPPQEETSWRMQEGLTMQGMVESQRKTLVQQHASQVEARYQRVQGAADLFFQLAQQQQQQPQ